jgi:hypothetical protein
VSDLGMCDCARTREYCVTRGCKRDDFKWRYSTEGREKDHLRRIVELRHHGTKIAKPRPISRWLRPERAVAEAWLMNMQARPGVVISIEKLLPDVRPTDPMDTEG